LLGGSGSGSTVRLRTYVPRRMTGVRTEAEAMERRQSLLRFRGPDGRVGVELLGPSEDFIDLVDPSDGAVRHAGPFVMHGCEWRIESVTLTAKLALIECVSTAAQLRKALPAPLLDSQVASQSSLAAELRHTPHNLREVP
jgi:hypothetical protein